VFLTTPFMIAIQLVSARIGRVTGKGLAANVMEVAPRWIVLGLVFLLVGANTVNIAADIAAMGEALSLVIGGLNHEHALIFAATSTLLQVFVPYRRYSPVLKFLTLSLFAYVATAFTVTIPWSTALLATVWPKATVNADYFLMVVAVLGTTISPYLFFWQASQEVEEMNQGKVDRPLRELRRGTHPDLERIRVDTSVGMILSNVIAFFIILTTATVLHANGATNISSPISAQRRRPPKRCGLWQAISPSCCSRSASSARACSPSPCLPARPPTASPRFSAGVRLWRPSRTRRRVSTPLSRRQP
jgi:Mn2+/Fe2+ NRAMP family transporter